MNILSLENVSKNFGVRPLFENVSLGLEPGDKIGIIGTNGAGKTTTVRTIMGFTASKGIIRFAGEDISPVEPHRRPALGIGYAPEDRRLFSAFTVEENVDPKSAKWETFIPPTNYRYPFMDTDPDSAGT